MSFRIVINADDFGMSERVNHAIVSCLRNKTISSATILANGPAWEEACALSREFPEASFGVHLNATQFAPITQEPGLEPYLADDGSFSGALRHRMARRDCARVADEWSAQVQRILDAGIRVSHLDSHHHSHTTPGAFGALKEVQRRYGIERVRTTRNLIPRRGSILRRGLKLVAKRVWHAALAALPPRTLTTDYFGGVTDLMLLLEDGPVGLYQSCSIELMCHPGAESPDYRREVEWLDSGGLETMGYPHTLLSYRDVI